MFKRALHALETDKTENDKSNIFHMSLQIINTCIWIWIYPI